MKGFVDDRNRALLPIQVASSLQAEPIEILVWIDTAFDGHLVFSKELVRKLQLDSLVETEAVLADGSKITMESYYCIVDWFGRKVPVQVIENDGRFPLLGTGLLDGRTIHINYDAKTVVVA